MKKNSFNKMENTIQKNIYPKIYIMGIKSIKVMNNFQNHMKSMYLGRNNKILILMKIIKVAINFRKKVNKEDITKKCKFRTMVSITLFNLYI